MTSRLPVSSLRKGLKAPSVHVGPSRPGAPPSATGSSSSAASASGLSAPHGYNNNARGGRAMSMAQMPPSGQSTGFGNQPQHHRDQDESSRPPIPMQRAAIASALVPTRTAPLGGVLGGGGGLGGGLGLPSMKTDNIRVVLRIRPGRKPSNGNQNEDPDEFMDDDAAQYNSSSSQRCLEVADSGAGVTIAPGSLQEKRFAFDRVFDDACSQEDIFQDAGLMAVENTLNGFNGCIFAYGQTGSGKTFTMLGGGDNGSQHAVHELKVSPLRGLMPRIFDHLIRRLEDLVADESNDLEYTLSCSYLEIYNEKVFDLLEVGAASQQPKSLREDSIKKEVYVDQLRQIPIKSAAEAIEYLQLGSRNRRMASTDMNRESSRSHAVFTIRLLQTHHTERGVLITRRSNLHLVDLAGSEKQRQTKAAGQRLKEAAQINKSLSALGNVIMALVDVSNGLKRHVHYRDSKLTFLLRDSLGGNSITTIIATISAEEKYFTETLSTLKFAQRAKFIKNKAVQNEDSDAMIPLLKQEIEQLRQEIDVLRSSSSSSQSHNNASSSKLPGDAYHPQTYGAYPSNNGGEAMVRPRPNKWEPALEMMERLLKASGAAAAENGDAEQDIFKLELRCQRLEMLLYRMICRFEEQKVVTFSSGHAHPAIAQQPTPIVSRAPSMLRKPKIKVVGKNDNDDARSTRSTRSTASASNNYSETEHELAEQRASNVELDAENTLLRHQLAEFMEWKGLVMDERRRSSVGVVQPPQVPEPSVGSPGIGGMLEEQRERNKDLLEALNAYRSMFADLSAVLDEKRDREASRSPTASVSTLADDRSVSGASVFDDDNDSVASEDQSADMDEDVFGTEREIRRIQNVSIKFDRRIEIFKDKIQQLKRNLVAVQDELDTSTAATKFAQFQLEQYRNSASRQDDIELELSELRDKYRRVSKRNSELERDLAAKQSELDDAVSKVHDNDELLSQLCSEHNAQAEGMRTLRASSEATELKLESTPTSNQLGQDEQEEHEDGDGALIAALHRIRELEEQLQRQRSCSIASSMNGSLLDAEVALTDSRTDSRVRAQSTPVVGLTALSDDEVQTNFETHQQLQKVLHGVLADNTDLIKTVRELQTEKSVREKEHIKELARLRDECDGLRKRLDEMRELAVTSISPSKEAKQKAETDTLIARLRSERKVLQTRLHQAQQQVRNLEDELTRSQSITATRRSIASDFFCEM